MRQFYKIFTELNQLDQAEKQLDFFQFSGTHRILKQPKIICGLLTIFISLETIKKPSVPDENVFDVGKCVEIYHNSRLTL